MLVSNVTLLLNISYKAEISIKGEEGKYNICGCFEKTEKYHSEPTDHSLQEEKKSFKIERETGRKNLVRVERKGQGFRRKDTGEIRCNSLFKSVLRRDLCQHNLIKWEESKTMQRKTVTWGKINTEENQRKNFIQFAARARHVRASQMLGNFHYYLSETITHLILL